MLPASLMPDHRLARRRAGEQQGIRGDRGEPLPLFSALRELGRAGVGVELYFKSIRWIVLAFLVLTGFGVPAAIANLSANHASFWRVGIASFDDFIKFIRDTMFATAPLASQGVAAPQAGPWLASTIVWLLLLLLLRVVQSSTVRKSGLRYLTSAHFAVEVTGLPVERPPTDLELAEFFGQFGDVHHIGEALSCKAFVDAMRSWRTLFAERRDVAERAERYPPAVLASKMAELDAQLTELEMEMWRMQREDLQPTGVAYICFETEHGRQACLDAHNDLSNLQWLLELSGCRELRPRFRHGLVLTVSPAPDATDVFWQNIGLSCSERRCRALVGGLLTATLIGASAALLLYVKANGPLLRLVEAAMLPQGTSSLASISISLMVAAVITGVNQGLLLVSRRLAHFEKRRTRTEHEESIFVKLATAFVINQSLLVLLLAPHPAYWLQAGGAFEEAFWIALSNAFVPEMLKLSRPHMFFNRAVRGRCAASQSRLQQLYRPPCCSLGELLASLCKTVALGLVRARWAGLMRSRGVLARHVAVFGAAKYHHVVLPSLLLAARFMAACCP